MPPTSNVPAALPAADSTALRLRESVHPDDDGDSGGGITPVRVAHALRRTWFLSVPVAVVAAGLVYVWAEGRITPLHTARSLVHVSPPSGLILDALGAPDTGTFQRTQLAYVRSRAVRQEVVRELESRNLATFQSKADPVAWLEKEIGADFTVAPHTLRLMMKGSDPDEVKLILDTVRDVYVRLYLNQDQAERVAKLQSLKEREAEQEKTVLALSTKVVERLRLIGLDDLNTARDRRTLLTNKLYSLQDELEQARLAAKGAEPGADPVPEPKKVKPPDDVEIEKATDRAADRDPITLALRDKIKTLEAIVADRERQKNYKSDPEYKALVDELAAKRQELVVRRAQLREEAIERLREQFGTRVVVVSPDAQRTRTAAQMKQLETDIARKKEELAALTRCLDELEPTRAELASQDELLKMTKARVRALGLELNTRTDARVLEDAIVVESITVSARKLKLAGVPTAAAFTGIVLFVAWLDLRRGRVNGGCDLGATKVRVLGTLPAVRRGVLPAFEPPAQEPARREYLKLTDALEMTRAVIAPTLASIRGYTLMVTSGVAGEGKTVLAAHLAARFARAGLRTLLIDTDVRRPQVADLLGLTSGPGFGDWVTGAVSKTKIVVAGPVSGLYVIAAGTADPRAVVELLDRRLPELLTSAKAQFDVVVLDAAPVLCTPEALALCRLADGVVLSVMRDVSRLSDIEACTERLESANARLLGAVVTGADAHRADY